MTFLTPAQQIAAVKDIAVAMLPPSASARERALLAAELARLRAYSPEIIATLWDPHACPLALLPWLAWALSVDVWDATWPESRKRAVIAAAPGVHRLKGTRAAVQRALDAMDITTDIVEWWQTVPAGRRGTATITAYIGADYGDDVILSERVQRQAITAIRGAKPKSRVAIYQVGVGFRSASGIAGVIQRAAGFFRGVEPILPMPASAAGLAGVSQSAMAVRCAVLPVSGCPAARSALAAIISSAQFVHVTMEAVA